MGVRIGHQLNITIALDLGGRRPGRTASITIRHIPLVSELCGIAEFIAEDSRIPLRGLIGMEEASRPRMEPIFELDRPARPEIHILVLADGDRIGRVAARNDVVWGPIASWHGLEKALPNGKFTDGCPVRGPVFQIHERVTTMSRVIDNRLV